MPTEAKAAAAPTDVAQPRRGRDRALAIALGVVVVLGVVAGAALLSGARMSSGTIGLLAATGALLLCLRALYRLASALTRPGLETVLDQEALLGVASQRELREEKRRLVRAINELTFDHEMGKLSAADYLAVKERYQLQAVEVIRALQDDRDLHPRLAGDLLRIAGNPDSDSDSDSESDSEPDSDSDSDSGSRRVCSGCATVNDVDARFCKQCGATMGEGAA